MLDFKAKVATAARKILQETGADRRIQNEGYTRVDPAWVAATRGVMVIRRPLDKLLGAFVREDSPGIIVNSQRSAGLINLTCAHELGHYFLGHGSTVDTDVMSARDGPELEREADWFAYCLLTSRATVALAMRRKGWGLSALRNPLHLYQLSLRLGVSYEATAWSLARLQLWNASDVKKMLRIEPAEIKRSILSRSEFESRADVWLLDERDQGLVLEPSTRDQVVLRLPNHASSGYLWSLDEARSEGFRILPVNSADHASAVEAESASGQLVTDHLLTGMGEREALTERVLGLNVLERRPWEVSGEQVSFRTAIDFEGATDGLSLGSRRRLLQSGSPSA